MKSPNNYCNIVYCHGGIDIERRSKLISDLSHGGLTVTPVPDEASCLVQLMNEVGLTIQHYYLTIYKTNV